MLVKDGSICILFHGGAWSNDYFSGSRRAIYSLFPEIPIRYATTHVSGLSGLPGDGLRRRRRAIREPCQERVPAQQRGGIAPPLRGIRHVRPALDPHGRLSG